MKKALVEKFLDSPHKRIALMGMSGVGKTHLSKKLPPSEWFHYSIDYRIGTHHLKDEVNDFLTFEAMKNPLLKSLIQNRAISVESRLSISNLAPLSAYLGMVGNPAEGGQPLAQFLDRLERHRLAEIGAIADVPYFMERAEKLYQRPNFIIDTSGSFCEIQDEKSWELIGQNALLIYIKASEKAKNYVIERAQSHPKPLYYQASFLLPKIEEYLKTHQLQSESEITPAHFTRWIFPQLIEHRLELYEMIAERYGVTIDAEALYHVKDQDQFFALIKESIDAQ
ncbi:hypothetical protein B9T19_10335 [Ignatzschineria sp. F8392]|uniref:hypothetical protein n=1 Tax=Ignatzschineria sp. F8392 TaxID=1980117 RepID=UPI000B9930B3|nr:hypothetical protein [Ignatzschineria sp. F8392]OYQ77277.1 hypothetical protein B9T19_10335 [Ignatzschineria sp. F8392]